MFCKYCGSALQEGANVCPRCGKAQSELSVQIVQQQDVAEPPVQIVQRQDVADPSDRPSFGYAFLGFLLPVIGLILYLVWKDQTPLKAHSAGKGALIGVIVWTALSIILAILAYVIPLLVFYSYY